MSLERVSIPCGTIVLEGILEIPDKETGSFGAAVLCHPHPLYGGNMNNNVTAAMAEGLLKRGLACLRFNFRGTGQSQGRHGDGIAEIDDVKAALDYLVGVSGIDESKILVTGYSFGCWVGLRAASEDKRPSALVGVSPPVDTYDFSYLEKELRPKLLMTGDRDFVCSLDRFNGLMDRIPEPKKAVILPQVDHFHIGREKYLVRETDDYLDSIGF